MCLACQELGPDLMVPAATHPHRQNLAVWRVRVEPVPELADQVEKAQGVRDRAVPIPEARRAAEATIPVQGNLARHASRNQIKVGVLPVQARTRTALPAEPQNRAALRAPARQAPNTTVRPMPPTAQQVPEEILAARAVGQAAAPREVEGQRGLLPAGNPRQISA